MSETVSIIIPAYNASSRIIPCLESVIAQTYPDIEIIVVDDGSCDDTGNIAREVLKSSGRNYTVTAHGHNKGVSAARNSGIDASSGEYICFADGDDVLRENFVSCLYDAIGGGNCDVSFCGFTDRFTDGRRDVDILPSGAACVSCEEKFILSREIPAVWCCMYRADFLRRCNLRFIDGCSYGEDIDFITRSLCRAGNAAFVPECLYIYIHHDGMGSVRDNDTERKRLMRYEHNTIAQACTAEYLCEHAKSRGLRDMAGKILMPQNVIRRLSLSAMRNDAGGYKAILNDGESMRILRRGLCFFTLRNKPEVFMKAVMIMIMPGMYYRMRAE